MDRKRTKQMILIAADMQQYLPSDFDSLSTVISQEGQKEQEITEMDLQYVAAAAGEKKHEFI